MMDTAQTALDGRLSTRYACVACTRRSDACRWDVLVVRRFFDSTPLLLLSACRRHRAASAHYPKNSGRRPAHVNVGRRGRASCFKGSSAHQKQPGGTPPFVLHEVAPRGEAIGLQIEQSDQDPINLCIRAEDVKHLVSLLLSFGHEAKRRQPANASASLPAEAIPVPVDAINVGQNHDDQIFLLFEAGIAPLMIVLPRKYLEQIAQTMLMFNAKFSSAPS